MKKIILIAAAAILTLSASAQDLKFAHVNFNELVMLMPESDQARATIDATQKEAEETFQGMYEEFQSKLQQYQQKSDTWTAAIKQSKEKELNDIQTRLQEFQQSVQQELSAKQNELMAPIQEKAMKAVEKLAKDGGYAFVFDASQFIFANDAVVVDLTKEARKALGIPEGRTLETLQAELQAAQSNKQQ